MAVAKANTLEDRGKGRGGKAAGRTKRPSKSRESAIEGLSGTSADDKKNKGDRRSAEEPSLILQIASLAAGAFQLAARAGDASWKVGRALLRTTSPEHAAMMQETGAFLKELRELAGLTRDELAEALDLSDRSLLEAVENGAATLSFELILRLAALLARHDPVPFIIRFTRTYHPEIWSILEKWGIGRIPVHLERERQFINIYRSRDAARKLSDEGFAQVLQFTRAAFEMALHFTSGCDLKSDPDRPERFGTRRKSEKAGKRTTRTVNPKAF
jgi:transcriptional regulator with XRE-family HTH domain